METKHTRFYMKDCLLAFLFPGGKNCYQASVITGNPTFFYTLPTFRWRTVLIKPYWSIFQLGLNFDKATLNFIFYSFGSFCHSEPDYFFRALNYSGLSPIHCLVVADSPVVQIICQKPNYSLYFRRTFLISSKSYTWTQCFLTRFSLPFAK